jgi:hypothetical protein
VAGIHQYEWTSDPDILSRVEHAGAVPVYTALTQVQSCTRCGRIQRLNYSGTFISAEAPSLIRDALLAAGLVDVDGCPRG